MSRTLLLGFGHPTRNAVRAQHPADQFVEQARADVAVPLIVSSRRGGDLVDVEAVLEALADLGLVETQSAVELTPDGPLSAAGSVPEGPGPLDTMLLSDGEVREDVVDEAVERTLQAGGEVSFVPDGTLADRESIAAVLRY